MDRFVRKQLRERMTPEAALADAEEELAELWSTAEPDLEAARGEVILLKAEIDGLEGDVQTLEDRAKQLATPEAATATFLDSDLGRKLLWRMAAMRLALQAVQTSTTLDGAQACATAALSEGES